MKVKVTKDSLSVRCVNEAIKRADFSIQFFALSVASRALYYNLNVGDLLDLFGDKAAEASFLIETFAPEAIRCKWPAVY